MKKLNNSIKKTLLTCSIIAATSISPTMAYEQVASVKLTSKQEQKEKENIGFGTGMVIGAIVAGPLGAIVSSAIGVITAKHLNTANERDELVAVLEGEQNKYQLALDKYQDKLRQAEQSYQAELLALQQGQDLTSQLQAENLLMSLQFSTGSSEIKPHYQAQITSLVKILEQSPNLKVDLSGYTDLQGSDELNHALSIARVNSVKKALISQGVQPERINLFAFGEQAPVVANQEKQTSFYDRRVVIKLQPKADNHSNQQTVKNYNK